MVKHTKKDIMSDITQTAVEDGLILLGYLFNGKTIPPLIECQTYKNLKDYFQRSKYRLDKTSKGIELSIRNRKYLPLKINEEDGNYWLKKFSIEQKYDGLEAKILLDIPVISREFTIIIANNKNHGLHECIKICYNNKTIYERDTKT